MADGKIVDVKAGLEALHALTDDEKNDPKKMLEIHEKYGLAWAHTIEFCASALSKKVFALTRYGKIEFEEALSRVAKVDESLAKYNESADISDEAAILTSYLGMDRKKAKNAILMQQYDEEQRRKKPVQVIDPLTKEPVDLAQFLANSIKDSMDFDPINMQNGMDAILKDTLKEANAASKENKDKPVAADKLAKEMNPE